MLLGKISEMDNVSLQQIINRILLFKYRYLGSLPSNFVSFLPNDTFAITNTQHSNMQVEHCIMIAISCHQLFFEDSLCREKYNFHQITPEPLQSHPSVCGSFTIYAAFHLFKFQQDGITIGHYVNVISFISNSMQNFNFFNKNVQVVQCGCLYLYTLIQFLKL